jgi:hypothetical protein
MVFESLRNYNLPRSRESLFGGLCCELSRRRVKASRKPWNERVPRAHLFVKMKRSILRTHSFITWSKNKYLANKSVLDTQIYTNAGHHDQLKQQKIHRFRCTVKSHGIKDEGASSNSRTSKSMVIEGQALRFVVRARGRCQRSRRLAGDHDGRPPAGLRIKLPGSDSDGPGFACALLPVRRGPRPQKALAAEPEGAGGCHRMRSFMSS